MNKEIKVLWENIYKKGYQIKLVDGTFYYVKNDTIKGFVNVNGIEQSLTPPTADEVCKALSEYWGNPFRYNKNTNLFEHYVGDIMWKRFNILILRTDAPDLIEMIGKFYKGEKDE